MNFFKKLTPNFWKVCSTILYYNITLTKKVRKETDWGWKMRGETDGLVKQKQTRLYELDCVCGPLCLCCRRWWCRWTAASQSGWVSVGGRCHWSALTAAWALDHGSAANEISPSCLSTSNMFICWCWTCCEVVIIWRLKVLITSNRLYYFKKN